MTLPVQRGGFTRVTPEPQPNAPRDPAGSELLPFAVNLIEERTKAVLVSRTDDGGVATAWLPKALINVEPTKGLGVHGVTVRIEVPRWLAEERGLIAKATEGQGDLF